MNYQIFYHYKYYYKELIPPGWLEQDIRGFVEQFLGETPNYQKYNDMTGVLIRCEKELYRRLKINTQLLQGIMESYDDEIAKYEEIKIIENGDI